MLYVSCSAFLHIIDLLATRRILIWGWTLGPSSMSWYMTLKWTERQAADLDADSPYLLHIPVAVAERLSGRCKHADHPFCLWSSVIADSGNYFCWLQPPNKLSQLQEARMLRVRNAVHDDATLLCPLPSWCFASLCNEAAFSVLPASFQCFPEAVSIAFHVKLCKAQGYRLIWKRMAQAFHMWNEYIQVQILYQATMSARLWEIGIQSFMISEARRLVLAEPESVLTEALSLSTLRIVWMTNLIVAVCGPGGRLYIQQWSTSKHMCINCYVKEFTLRMCPASWFNSNNGCEAAAVVLGDASKLFCIYHVHRDLQAVQHFWITALLSKLSSAFQAGLSTQWYKA